MLDELKLLLGESANNYPDMLISLVLHQSQLEVKGYTKREELDEELDVIAMRIAVIRLNRMNSEGLASQSYSGVSESYVDGYPADILEVLNRKRIKKVRVI